MSNSKLHSPVETILDYFGCHIWVVTNMAHEDLDALLLRMDAIAKAVNAFSSDAVQQSAFSALVAAFEGQQHSSKQTKVPVSGAEPEHSPVKVAGINNGKTRKATKTKKSGWTFLKELDLRPIGKQSFQAFVDEKKPASNEDKYAVVVYYLSEIAELAAVSVSHVGSAFKLTKNWREPGDVSAGLSMTSSRKGTLDTRNLDRISVTSTGRNFVEHDLPAQKTKKK